MNRSPLLLAATAAVFAGACASTDKQPAGDPQSADSQYEERYIPTGSHIPRKDKSSPSAVKSAEGRRAEDILMDAQRGSMPPQTR